MGLKGSTKAIFVRGVTETIDGNTRRVDLELFSFQDGIFAPLQFSALVRPGLFWDVRNWIFVLLKKLVLM